MKKPSLLSQLSIADYITLAAILLINIALYLLLQGQTHLAIALAFVSMFLDYLDGTIARKYGGSPYGKVLDSLYDIIGFVLFPSMAINVITHWSWWSMVVTTAFLLSASLRLARFTSEGFTEVKNKRYYIGLPVLYSKYALLVVLLWDAKLSTLILALMIPMMVSSRLTKKPSPILAQLNLVYALIFLLLYLR